MTPKCTNGRHLVENFLCSLKAFRRIATRYEKTDASSAGLLNLVASFLARR
jgi:transposase